MTECDLDDKTDWDFNITNNGDEESKSSLEECVQYYVNLFSDEHAYQGNSKILS